MKLTDVGWVWEGQGLDPGVHPSVLGLGDGARYFGLKRCHFLYHPTTDLALQQMKDMEEVVPDVSKWLHRDAGRGGSESYGEPRIERVCTEAELIGKFSQMYPNITGAVHDDMLGLLRRAGFGAERYGEVVHALKRHNEALKLWCVLYAKELDPKHWEGMQEHIDIISLWRGYDDLPGHVRTCSEIFPGKPIYVGCYLRDYQKAAPMPMEIVQDRFETVLRLLDQGSIAGYAILGTVLIDGHIEQAEWIRDFIAKHS